MKFFRKTADHKKYWSDRKIDWKTSYLDTWNHPHRYMISAILGQFHWVSLFEIGVGSGPNLKNILAHFKDKQLGGIDVNKDAVEMCDKVFQGGIFSVGSAEDILMSDNSCDVVLSDMCLIYLDPSSIDKAIGEIKRVARKMFILCEFHHTNPFKRFALRFRSGYNAYDYRKLLQKHGCYDIKIIKIPPEAWPGGDPQKTFGNIIIARPPKRK